MVQQYIADRLTNSWRQVRQMIFNPVRHGGIKVFGELSNSGNGVKLIDAYFRWQPAAEESQN